MITLAQLGLELDLRVSGDPEHVLTALAPIESADANDLTFVVGRRYSTALQKSKAGAVILPEAMLEAAPGNALISPNPYASYAKASWILTPPKAASAGIHPTVVVHQEATVAPTASIGAFSVIGAGCRIEDHASVGAHCTLGSDVVVGQGTTLFSGVRIHDNVVLGNQCRLQCGAVVGSEGFGYAWTGSNWSQIQQTGGVRIGNNVHIGANTTIDCGAIGPTVIEDGVILDNQIQIAHNVHIGCNTAIAGCVGIAGSTKIGAHCQIGGACNIVGHLKICDCVVINAASLVTRSIQSAGRYGSGMPLQSDKTWRRNFVNLGRLEDLFKRVRRLERREKSDESDVR